MSFLRVCYGYRKHEEEKERNLAIHRSHPGIVGFYYRKDILGGREESPSTLFWATARYRT